jgi:hypothetical protein
LLQELGELDHADDGQDQRQPHIGADGPDLHLPDQDEGEDRQADQEIHGNSCCHGLNANQPGRGAQVLIVQARQ